MHLGGLRINRQRACDGHHSRHSVCSTWTDAIVLEVERRELGLLVALDGLADCAYALILEVVVGQIQGRQRTVDAQSVGNRCDALGVVRACGHATIKPDTTEAGI